VLRSTWDYAERRDSFLAWVGRLPHVQNKAAVVRWNTDKHYLGELAAAGVPVVPTTFLEPGMTVQDVSGAFVVKPAVSAGGRQAARYEPGELGPAGRHVAALHAEGRAVMLQPYVAAVDERGESALHYIAGRFSHAVSKAALLAPGHTPTDVLYLPETITPLEPSPGERAVGERVLDALPFARDELLYARVDLVESDEGPAVLEVELTEPSLYLSFGAGAVGRLASAIAGVLGRR
jgi:glutathione synthase/RimK-type ligase-like ATP-grasp enzyme